MTAYDKNIGFVGLGRMGGGIVENLLSKDYRIVGYDLNQQATAAIAARGATPASSLENLASKLTPGNKTVWMMVPAGKPVDATIDGLLPHLSKNDILIDGGNSHWRDSARRHDSLKPKGVEYLDCGTSGGLAGARYGASLTVGGDADVVARVEPLFRDIAIKDGYAHVGPAGAGHFAKMVHNAAEYAIEQALGDAFHTLQKAPHNFSPEQIAEIFGVWNNGSIIRSYLTGLAGAVLAKNSNLQGISGAIGGGETGQWVLDFAREVGADHSMVEAALSRRASSQQSPTPATQLVAALRNAFGGHEFLTP